MSVRYIVAAAVGPVGSFIAAGRRSRDLWYGSRFLSEVTRIAAKELEKQRVKLLIPLSAQIHASFLAPHSYRGPTVTNKILGVLDAGEADADLAKRCLRAAETAARAFVAKELYDLLEEPRLKGVLVREYVRKQADAIKHGDFVEFYGSWAPIGDGPDAETQAISRVLRLLGARKTARVFTAPAAIAPGVPKSSLDPGRESVLIELDPRTPAAEQKARRLEARRVRAGIRPEERLDAVGLARRRAMFRAADAKPGVLPFPSLGRVALDPWIDGALASAPEPMQQVLATLATLDEGAHDREDTALYFISSPVRDPGPRRPDQEPRRFGYDPDVLFEGAIPALRKTLRTVRRLSAHPSGVHELANDPDNPEREASSERAYDALGKLVDPVAKLHSKCGVPQPYYALLEADGDGMGKLLERVPSGEARTALVRALYEFSERAWDIIEAHQGCAFYAGGDELAAYLPADRAVHAATELTSAFAAIAGKAAATHLAAAVAEIGPATLSAGIAIAHVRDDLRWVRRIAHSALDEAKARRRKALEQALAAAEPMEADRWGWLVVHEVPRAGSTRPSGGPTKAFQERHDALCKLLAAEAISLSLAHDLLTDAEALDRQAQGGPIGLDIARARLRQKEARANREQVEGAEREEPHVLLKALRTRLASVQDWQQVRDLAAEILLAERTVRVRQQRPAQGGASQ